MGCDKTIQEQGGGLLMKASKDKLRKGGVSE